MLSNIFISKIRKDLNGKTIDLNTYNHTTYQIFEEGTEKIINFSPITELIEVLRELGYMWGNGLRLHINNFSKLTETGEENRRLLKTHRYIEINDNWINLAYSPKKHLFFKKRKDIITIEYILEQYYEYKRHNLGIIPDVRDLKIGDYIYYSKDGEDYIIKITGYHYERPSDSDPAYYIVTIWNSGLNLKQSSHEIMENWIRAELKSILKEEKGIKLNSIDRRFRGKWISLYNRHMKELLTQTYNQKV